MGTRSGDMDPAIALHLINSLGLAPKDTDTLLNKKSGLLGVCGDSDLRAVIDRSKAGDQRAQLALDMFVYRCAAASLPLLLVWGYRLQGLPMLPPCWLELWGPWGPGSDALGELWGPWDQSVLAECAVGVVGSVLSAGCCPAAVLQGAQVHRLLHGSPGRRGGRGGVQCGHRREQLLHQGAGVRRAQGERSWGPGRPGGLHTKVWPVVARCWHGCWAGHSLLWAAAVHCWHVLSIAHVELSGRPLLLAGASAGTVAPAGQ
jgi:hypothetical protein